jgi:hypothetical protein
MKSNFENTKINLNEIKILSSHGNTIPKQLRSMLFTLFVNIPFPHILKLAWQCVILTYRDTTYFIVKIIYDIERQFEELYKQLNI